MPTRAYFDTEHSHDLLAWLQTRPEGAVQLMIGCHDSENMGVWLMDQLKSDRDLALWVMNKTTAGQFVVKARLPIPDMKNGVVTTE